MFKYFIMLLVVGAMFIGCEDASDSGIASDSGGVTEDPLYLSFPEDQAVASFLLEDRHTFTLSELNVSPAVSWNDPNLTSVNIKYLILFVDIKHDPNDPTTFNPDGLTLHSLYETVGMNSTGASRVLNPNSGDYFGDHTEGNFFSDALSTQGGRLFVVVLAVDNDQAIDYISIVNTVSGVLTAVLGGNGTTLSGTDSITIDVTTEDQTVALDDPNRYTTTTVEDTFANHLTSAGVLNTAISVYGFNNY